MPVCEICQGRPPAVVVAARYVSGTPIEQRQTPITIRCAVCRSSGVVPAWQVRRTKQGLQLKKCRLSAGAGLRQCAELLRLSASELCAAEQGLLPTADIRALRRKVIAFYQLSTLKPGYSVW